MSSQQLIDEMVVKMSDASFEQMIEECAKMRKQLEECEKNIVELSNAVSELKMKSCESCLKRKKIIRWVEDGFKNITDIPFSETHFYECKKCSVLTENESEICMECL